MVNLSVSAALMTDFLICCNGIDATFPRTLHVI